MNNDYESVYMVALARQVGRLIDLCEDFQNQNHAMLQRMQDLIAIQKAMQEQLDD